MSATPSTQPRDRSAGGVSPLHAGLVAGAGAVLAAAAVLWVTAPYGPGASPDSVTYLSVAGNLVAGQGWVRFDGLPYVAWPPLYPLTLALGVGAGLEPIAAARLLNALAFALALAAGVLAVARASGSLAWAALAGLLALASPAVLETYATAWSEGLFSTLVVVAIALAVRGGTEPSARAVLGLALLAGLAFLTRYIGVVLAAALGVWLLALPATPSLRLRRAFLFGGVAALGPLAWLLRNQLATGSAAGRRGEAIASLSSNAAQLSVSVARMLGVDHLGDAGAALAVATVLGVATLGLLAAWRQRASPGALPLVAALFILLYTSSLVGLASWTPVAALRVSRFAMPLWLPFALVVGCLGAAAWQRWPGTAPRLALALLITLPAVHGTAATLGRAREFRERGVFEFGHARWHGSGLLDAVRSRRPETPVLTNFPHGVWLHTGLAVGYSPRRRGFRSTVSRVDTLETLRRRVAAEGSVPFAWFIVTGRGNRYYAPQDLAAEGFCLLGREQHTDGIYFDIVDAAQCPGPRLVPPPGRGRRTAP